MKKFTLVIMFLIMEGNAFASPARLGGFSYKTNEFGRIDFDEGSEKFNNGPPALSEQAPPERPFYLNEDLSDARNSVTPQQEKYKLLPVYSVQSLYDMKKNKQTTTNNNEEIEEEDGELEDEEEEE